MKMFLLVLLMFLLTSSVSLGKVFFDSENNLALVVYRFDETSVAASICYDVKVNTSVAELSLEGSDHNCVPYSARITKSLIAKKMPSVDRRSLLGFASSLESQSLLDTAEVIPSDPQTGLEFLVQRMWDFFAQAADSSVTVEDNIDRFKPILFAFQQEPGDLLYPQDILP